MKVPPHVVAVVVILVPRECSVIVLDSAAFEVIFTRLGVVNGRVRGGRGQRLVVIGIVL